MMRRIILLGFLAGGSLALSSCILPRPVEDQTRYYLLEASAGEGLTESSVTFVEPDDLGLIIGLRRIRVADYVNTPSLAVRTADGRLRYVPYHRWAESLDRSLARMLRETLRQQPSITSVYFFPEAGREAVDFEIDLQFLACDAIERDDGSGAYLFKAYWSVYDAEGGRVIASGDFVRRGDWQPGDYAAFARSISGAGTQLSGELAEVLERLAGAE